jgi:hypothetical protein
VTRHNGPIRGDGAGRVRIAGARGGAYSRKGGEHAKERHEGPGAISGLGSCSGLGTGHRRYNRRAGKSATRGRNPRAPSRSIRSEDPQTTLQFRVIDGKSHNGGPCAAQRARVSIETPQTAKYSTENLPQSRCANSRCKCRRPTKKRTCLGKT